MKRVLVVDDSEMIRSLLDSSIRALGFSVDLMSCGEDAVQQCYRVRYDVVFLDWHMGNGMNGGQVLWELRKICPKTKVVLITGFVEEHEQVVEIAKTKFDRILYKPFQLKEIKEVLDAMTQTPAENLCTSMNDVLDVMAQLSRLRKEPTKIQDLRSYLEIEIS